jgi:hypothetical protein
MFAHPILVALGCATAAILFPALVYAVYLEGLFAWISGGPREQEGCPRCRRGIIERVAATSVGDRFYRCDRCGGRYRRSSRDGPFLDASAPRHDRAFLRRTREGTCEKPVPPIDEEACWTRTIDTLVWLKRSGGLSGVPRQKSERPKAPEPLASLWDRELDL